MGMKYVAAYLMAALAGKESPSADDIKTILESVESEYDESIASKLVSELEGKVVHEVVAAGKEKLKGFGGGGGGVAVGGGGGGGAAAPAEAKKEEKKVEEEEEEEDMEFDLFGWTTPKHQNLRSRWSQTKKKTELCIFVGWCTFLHLLYDYIWLLVSFQLSPV